YDKMCIHLNLMIFTKIIRGFISARQWLQGIERASAFLFFTFCADCEYFSHTDSIFRSLR
ncbi:hypothetical protein, partial [Escherichia coli]|uniref:hypothetical protein n=1 Tax=Escherichia coli TaxID=562 RepID=UPI002F2682A5